MNDTGEGTHDARLAANIILGRADGGRIAENIVFFARLLRAAGLSAGPQKTILATQAVMAAGIGTPQMLYWALHAVFVTKRAEHDIFRQAFHLFWRDPGYINQLLSVMMPSLRPPAGRPPDAMARRLAESLISRREKALGAERDKLEMDASGSWSELEVFQAKDFEQMSADELRLAKAAARTSGLLLAQIRTRRFQPAQSGPRLDIRRILRETGAKGPEALRPLFQRHQQRTPPLVVLCDISGSMDVYARIFLHYLYALTNERARVHTFLFGTRLTHITRALSNRDPDIALAKVTAQVQDWSGGTRIGKSLGEFNRLWARRVLGQNAVVLLFTDGLDRSGGEGVALAARRLAASSRRLIWLNPLLRFQDYAPLAAGARELAKHVSEIRPCHNLLSLAGLAAALSAAKPR